MASEVTQRQRAEAVIGKHYECEDPWYSCPLSEEGCANETMDKSECTCGLESKRQAVNELLQHARREALREANVIITQAATWTPQSVVAILDCLTAWSRERPREP